MIRSVWCTLPWFHKAVQTDGSVKPCCSWSGEQSDDDPEWLSGRLPTALRQTFSSGRPDPGCRNCVLKESSGNSSWRRLSFDMADDVGLSSLDDHSLRSVEVNLSNLCNLRCRTCNGDNSSKWIADEIDLGMRSPDSAARKSSGWTLSDSDAKTVRLVEFLGGEPLLHQDEILRNLRKVDDPSRLGVTLTTNGTVAIDDGLADLLSRCQRVHINVSVDGYGNLNDYIRSDSSWQSVVSMLHWLDGMAMGRDNFSYGMCSVYSILNCNKLPELWGWYDGEGSGLRYTPRQAVVIPLIGPSFYDVKNLPARAKERVLDRLFGYHRSMAARRAMINGLMDYVNLEASKPFDEVHREFWHFNGYLDSTRSTSLHDVNHEIADLMG